MTDPADPNAQPEEKPAGSRQQKRAGKGQPLSADPGNPDIEAPAWLVWNQTRGVRQTVASEPAGVDEAGLVRHKLTTVKLMPGLNLVPATEAEICEAGMHATEGVVVLPRGLEGLPRHTAILAIKETGLDQVLSALARTTEDDKLSMAIAEQVTTLAKLGVAGVRARDLRLAHTVRT